MLKSYFLMEAILAMQTMKATMSKRKMLVILIAVIFIFTSDGILMSVMGKT